MKKFYLLAAPFCLLFVGCNDDSDSTLTETSSNYQYASYSKKHHDASSIVFELELQLSPQSWSNLSSLYSAVKSAALSHDGFISIAQSGFDTTVGTEWTTMLGNNPASIIMDLENSESFKVALAEVMGYTLTQQYTSLVPLTEDEKKLLQQCTQIYDTGDDDRRDKRTLSFAIGYQYSEANAIIMATTAGLLP